MKVTDQMETAQKDTAAETTLQSRYYISSMAGQAKPCWRPPEDIGVSKTACIGPWTLPFEKTSAVSARIMAPRTWQSCAR